MGSMPANKEVKKAARRWVDAGFSVSPAPSGHWKVTDDSGVLICTLPSSPSDHRWMKNQMAHFNRVVGRNGGQKKEKQPMLAQKAAFKPDAEQERVSNQMFRFLRGLGWPNERGIRADVIRHAIRVSEEMYGRNGVWGSEGSANAAVTDLISGKRKVGVKALAVFNRVSEDHVPTRPVDLKGEVVGKKKSPVKRDDRAGTKPSRIKNNPELMALATSKMKAILDEIDSHNLNGVRKHHTRRFGTVKYLATWAMDQAEKRAYTMHAPSGKAPSLGAIEERIRSADFENRGSYPYAKITADLLVIAAWWDEASTYEKWALVPSLGLSAHWDLPETVELEIPATETVETETMKVVEFNDSLPPLVLDVVDSVEREDTQPVTGNEVPLHMRVLYALSDSRRVDKDEALTMAMEIAALEVN